MGSQFHWNHTKCSRSSSPPLSSPQLSLLDLPPMEPPLLMPQRSFPPSLSPTSTEWLMTTARPTSRRQRVRQYQFHFLCKNFEPNARVARSCDHELWVLNTTIL